MLFLNHKTDTQISLKIGDATITQVKQAKLLGITFNDKLNWNDQIYGTGGLVNSLNQRIFLIRRLKMVISNEALIKVADSLFMSKVRYGLQLLGKVRITDSDPVNKELEDIQIVQNRLVRTLNGKRLSDKIRTSVLLTNINMLSINQTHAQIKLLEIWKSFNDTKNNILRVEKVKSYEQGSRTRSGTALNLVEIRTSMSSSKTFKNDAIRLWNIAPESIKKCDSIYSAKLEIKHFTKTLPI